MPNLCVVHDFLNSHQPQQIGLKRESIHNHDKVDHMIDAMVQDIHYVGSYTSGCWAEHVRQTPNPADCWWGTKKAGPRHLDQVGLSGPNPWDWNKTSTLTLFQHLNKQPPLYVMRYVY